MKQQAIYDYIYEHMVGDVLPEDFQLPREEENVSISFADGAMDGICIYHMGMQEVSTDALEKIVLVFKKASELEFEFADAIVSEICNEYRVIQLIDTIQECVWEHQTEIKLDKVYRYALHLMLDSNQREPVKFGLALVELYETSDEVNTVIQQLGLSDEFTIFSTFNMRKWENGNEAIFELVQKVHGWGRIHAIESLEASTNEIKSWLLKNGIDNEVMSAYSALTVFHKAEVEALLRKNNITYEEFQSIGKIIVELYDEGPVIGISEIENAEEILLMYLKHAEKQRLLADDFYVVHYIREEEQEKEIPNKLLVQKCNALLECLECKNAIREAIKTESEEFGKYIKIAKEFGIPYQEEAYQLIASDLDRYAYVCKFLMSDTVYLEKVLDLFRKSMDLEDFVVGAADEIGLGAEYKVHNNLDFLLQELKENVGYGEDILEKTLQSPTVRNRNLSIKVLKAWTIKEKKDLEQVSPRLWNVLKQLIASEVREDIKLEMATLLTPHS